MLPVLLLILAGFSVQLAAAGIAAASSTQTFAVAADLASASTLGTTGCASSTANVTALGTVNPGTSKVTSSDCVLTFNSSNDSSMLRAYQADGFGFTMNRVPAGPLDTSFSGNGWDTVDVSGGTANDNLEEVAMQSDGKIVAVGRYWNGTDYDMLIERYTTAGALDTTFSSNGRFEIDVTSGYTDDAYGVAIQPDQKIVVVGDSTSGGTSRAVAARITSTGTLDTTFNSTGLVINDIYSGAENYDGVIIQSDGRIVAGGHRTNAGLWEGIVDRIQTDGTMDPTWGSNGNGRVDLPANVMECRQPLLDSQQRVICNGQYRDADLYKKASVTRLSTLGAVDGTYGTSGTSFKWAGQTDSTNDNIVSATILPDDTVVLSGYTFTTVFDGIAVKFQANGGADLTFDSDGVIHATYGATGEAFTGVAVDGANRLVFASVIMVSGQGSAGLARYHLDGSEDDSFDADGQQHNDFHATLWDLPIDVTIGTDNEYVAVGSYGYAPAGQEEDTLIYQYDTDAISNYVLNTTDWDQGTSGVFGACIRSLTGATVSGPWAVDADNTCGTVDATDSWYQIPIAPDTGGGSGGKLAYKSSVGGADAEARLRFGMRTETNTPPGQYLAPVIFEVVAPNVGT